MVRFGGHPKLPGTKIIEWMTTVRRVIAASEIATGTSNRARGRGFAGSLDLAVPLIQSSRPAAKK
jgi:hypothetical protein